MYKVQWWIWPNIMSQAPNWYHQTTWFHLKTSIDIKVNLFVVLVESYNILHQPISQLINVKLLRYQKTYLQESHWSFDPSATWPWLWHAAMLLMSVHRWLTIVLPQPASWRWTSLPANILLPSAVACGPLATANMPHLCHRAAALLR